MGELREMAERTAKEKREKHLKNLIEGAIKAVLLEQEVEASSVPPSPVPPSPQTNNAEVTDAQNQQLAQPEPEEESKQEEFNVDDLVDKLNVLRGGRSFTDPEIFGKLTTFFNNLSDNQKDTLNYLLTELGKIVIEASEEQINPEQQQQNTLSGNAQPPPPAPSAQQAPQAPPAAPAAPITPQV